MATTTWTSVFTNTGDANFRDWGSKLSAGLAAVGMVKTADTGQVNWSTVTAPGGTNTQQGYEVWRFNDALQGTAPIFLRIGYGSGGSADRPMVWVTIGKGSDGAGTITGVLQTAQTSIVGITGTTGTFTSYASSGDGSVVAFSVAPSYFGATGACASLIVVERSRTAGGAPTGDGIMFFSTGTTSPATKAIPYASGTAVTLTGFPVAFHVSTGSDSSMATAGAGPVFPGVVYANGFIWQPRGVVSGLRADVGAYSVFTATGIGTYLSLGSGGQKCDITTGTYATACMVWS